MAGAVPFDADAFMAAILTASNAAALNQQAAMAAAGPPAAAAVVVRPFARLPGMQNLNALDYQKPEEFKIFSKASEGFTDKFDLTDEHLYVFLAMIKDRSDIYNWNTIMMVPDSANVPRNLLTNFGQISLENCRAHAITVASVESRNAQNDVMLYFLLVNSMTKDARTKAMAVVSDHTNLITIAPKPAELVQSGIMLLKVIIGKASVDTHAKVLMLRQEIASLPYKMTELKGDVQAFNMYAQRKRDELLCRGEAADELVAHLFTAYLRSPDENFVRYVQAKKDKYEEDDLITADQLLSLAIIKYDLIKQQAATLAEGDERIVAMNVTQEPREDANVARFVAMEASLRLMQERLTSRGGAAGNGRRRGNRKNDQAHAWKKIKPKDGEPRVKIVSGRTYNWCRFHDAWTMHTDAECTLGHQQPATVPNPPAAAPRGSYSAAANRAMMSMMYEEDSA